MLSSSSSTGASNVASRDVSRISISITSLTRGDIVINTGISTAAGGTITLSSSDDINIQSEAIAINSGSGGAINLNVDTNNEIAAILDLGGAVLNSSTINFNRWRKCVRTSSRYINRNNSR